jgi:hypothetical protein
MATAYRLATAGRARSLWQRAGQTTAPACAGSETRANQENLSGVGREL